MSDIDWKAWFQSWGEHRTGHSYTLEEMYQAFKARYAAETSEETPNAGETTEGA